MPELDKISKITLPNGVTYAIEDENVSIDSTYVSADQEVILTVGSLDDADTTEY